MCVQMACHNTLFTLARHTEGIVSLVHSGKVICILSTNLLFHLMVTIGGILVASIFDQNKILFNNIIKTLYTHCPSLYHGGRLL